MIRAGGLLRAMAAYGALELASRLVQAASIFLLAASFDKPQFGLFYSYLAIYQFVTVLGSGGLTESLMSRLAGRDTRESPLAMHRHLGSHMRRYLQRAAFLAVPLAVVAYLVFLRGQADRSFWVLIAAVLSGLSYGLVMLVAGYLTCAGANRESFYLRSAYAGLSFLVATVMALASGDILYFYYGLCAAGIGAAMLAIRVAPGIKRGWWSSGPMDGSADGSWWFVVPSVLNWFFWYGLVLCVSSYFGKVQAAELAFVNNLATIILLINSAVSQAWISRYLRLVSHASEAAEQSNASVYRLQSILILAATVSMVVSYRWLSDRNIPLLQKYSGIGLRLMIVLFAVSLSSAYFSAVNAYAVNNQGRQLAGISMIAYFLSVAVLIVAAAWYGMIGVYVGFAALIVSRGFAVTYFAMKRFGSGFFDARIALANIVCFLMLLMIYH